MTSRRILAACAALHESYQLKPRWEQDQSTDTVATSVHKRRSDRGDNARLGAATVQSCNRLGATYADGEQMT